VQEPILRIPTLAIHLDRTISSEGLKINNQSHLVPVLAASIKNEMQKIVGENGLKESLENKNMKQLIAKEANCEPDEICNFELQLCDTQPSAVAGAIKEFIFSGQLDNLCMPFCSLKLSLAMRKLDLILLRELVPLPCRTFYQESRGLLALQIPRYSLLCAHPFTIVILYFTLPQYSTVFLIGKAGCFFNIY